MIDRERGREREEKGGEIETEREEYRGRRDRES